MPTRKRTVDDEDDDTSVSLEGLESGGEAPEGDAEAREDSGPPEGVSPNVELSPGWFSMDVAPTNGRPVIVCGIVGGVPLTTPAYLYKSRRWGGSALRWVPYEEWRMLWSPDKVPFEPLCWTRFEQ